MKPWQSLVVIALNGFVLSAIAASDSPMTINPEPILLAAWEKAEWSLDRFNTSLDKAIARKEAKLNGRSQGTEIDNGFCKPEFGPVPLAAFSDLPEDRTVDQITKVFGQPCHRDDEQIYYLLQTGEIIYFSKRTGKGGFQGQL